MIGALKQLNAGRTAADMARELGVSKHTIYAWKANRDGGPVVAQEGVAKPGTEEARIKESRPHPRCARMGHPLTCSANWDSVETPSLSL